MSEHHGDRIHAPTRDTRPVTLQREELRDPHVPGHSQPASLETTSRRTESHLPADPADKYSATGHPSPAPSVISSGSSSRLRDAVLDATRRLSTQIDLGSATRPTVQRDLSHASAISTESTESNITVTPYNSQLARHAIPAASNFYPNQAFSALHYQKHPPIHVPPSVPPSLKQATPWSPTSPRQNPTHTSGARTWGNSPAGTPGLFQPSPSKSAGNTPTREPAYQSPYLHHLHHQIPKETHVADIDVDPISGRKIINNYEIIDELGRGTHGKVKLGRSLTDGRYVAIKIVERFPKKRRLGRLGNAEDKVKREVAILKKARHPHVVALLEVIDDPARRKVYIILERVDLGEIPWRTRGSREIAIIECRRYERESRGRALTAEIREDDEAVLKLGRVRRAKAAREKFRAAKKMQQGDDYVDGGWSLELNGDLDDDSEFDTASRQSSSTDDISPEEMNRIISKPVERVPIAGPDPLETVKPRSSTTATITSDDGASDTLASLLDGTMYGAAAEPIPRTIAEEEEQLPYHQTESQPLEPALTREDADIDVGKLYRDLSHDDLANRAASILDCDILPDLLFVPCMTFQAARETFRDTLLGLQYLHYQGIIHRDIKPPNLLQTRDHRTKISDFGVSYLGRPMEEDGDESSDADVSVDEAAKELAKNVGTPAFYAPELCFTGAAGDSAPIGKGIDIWALGVTLFCMIFARVPFVDNEYIVMRRIAEEEVYIPKQRLRPVDTRPQSRDDANILHYTSNTTYRGAHALEYEELDDLLLDLLRRLLTKDVKKRATLDEVRHHPWVMDDLPDKMAWLDMSAPSNNAEGKKIEISREDLETSVVPISIIDRIRSGIKKAVGLGRSSSSRRRNASQDSTAPGSAASLTVSVQGRRPSLRPVEDTVVFSPKSTRDPDQSLGQSTYTSPVVTPGPKSRGESVVHTPNAKSGPSKTIMSSANSSKTVRAIDAVSEEGYFGGSVPSSPLIATALDSPGSGNFSTLLSGARGLLKSVRDRSSTGRSEDKRSVASDRSSEMVGDSYADPSVALSTEIAYGQSITTRSNKDSDSISSRSASPAMSRNSSIVSTPDLAVRQTGFEDFHTASGRNRSTSTSQSLAPMPSVSLVSRSGLVHSTSREYDRAEKEMIRRHAAEDVARASPKPISNTMPQPEHCPLSPDDEHIQQTRKVNASPAISTDSAGPSKVPSLEIGLTSPTSSAVPVITPVSSADHLKYEMPSALPEADTIIGLPEKPKDKGLLPPIIESAGSPQQSAFMRKTISDDEAYHADAAIESDEYEDSSDDDGGLTMMRRKSVPHPSSRSISVSNAQLVRNRERRATGGSATSKKSSRSGSIKTARKNRERSDSLPDEQRGRKLSN